MNDPIRQALEELAELAKHVPARVAAPIASDERLRWRELDRQIGDRVAGQRVLVLGGDAAADARELARRGAGYVLACVEDGDDQPQRLDSREQPLEFRSLRWDQLDPARHGSFGLVLCSNLAHRVSEPVRLLEALRALTEEGGSLVLGSVMIDDPERSEYLRFVPDRYAGDPSWWFVPGRLALRWLLEKAGFEVECEFGEREGPRDLFGVIEGYVKATAR